MVDPGFRRGGRSEGLSEEHFGFTAAAARVDADSHADAALSAGIAERDSANTVNIRPGGHTTVADSPFDGATVVITSEASQTQGVGASVEGTAAPKYDRTLTLVEVSTDGGTTFANATGTDTWTFDVSGLAAETYEVVVRAVDSLGVVGPEATQELVLA